MEEIERRQGWVTSGYIGSIACCCSSIWMHEEHVENEWSSPTLLFSLQLQRDRACTEKCCYVQPFSDMWKFCGFGILLITLSRSQRRQIGASRELKAHKNRFNNLLLLGGGFKQLYNIFFSFTPTCENNPSWLMFFKGVETTNQPSCNFPAIPGGRCSKVSIPGSGFGDQGIAYDIDGCLGSPETRDRSICMCKWERCMQHVNDVIWCEYNIYDIMIML